MKNILKAVLLVIFMASLSGTIIIYLIQKTAVSEKTLSGVADNKKVVETIYQEFIEIMSTDYVSLFKDIIPEEDIKSEFRSAYPREKFKTELKTLLSRVAKYLKGEVESPNHSLDLSEFKKKIAEFFKNRAEKETKTENKKLLERYSTVMLHYPDNFPMLRLDDIEHIDEMKENFEKLNPVFTKFLIITLISLIIIMFDIKLFSLGLLLTGLVNFIGTFAVKSKVVGVLAKNPEPAQTIAKTVARHTINSILIISVILLAAGLILFLIKKQGGK